MATRAAVLLCLIVVVMPGFSEDPKPTTHQDTTTQSHEDDVTPALARVRTILFSSRNYLAIFWICSIFTRMSSTVSTSGEN